MSGALFGGGIITGCLVVLHAFHLSAEGGNFLRRRVIFAKLLRHAYEFAEVSSPLRCDSLREMVATVATYTAAVRSQVAARVRTPRRIASGAVYSSGAWLMPSRLGTKTIPARVRSAMLCTSCPAPLAIRIAV